MTPARLDEILSRFGDLNIAVVGDFFLDKYLELDPGLAEASLETGLTAHQVVAVRNQPGAAGTVVANLCALGAGRVRCLGFVGDDGEGYDLRRGLEAIGADPSGLLVRADCFTPTYCKPMVREAGRVRELERFDTKNRRSTPPEVEEEIVSRLRRAAREVQGVIALDQVQEAECGVITTRVRAALAELAEAHPKVVWFGDSRTRVGEYRNLTVKSNREETCRAAHPWRPSHRGTEIGPCAMALARRTGRPAYVTVGAEGIVFATAEEARHVSGVPVTGEVDIVGAGDSATAALVASLCAGGDPLEAALVANLVASITIQQLGTTGTATPDQVRARLAGR